MERCGPVQACNGIDLPLPLPFTRDLTVANFSCNFSALIESIIVAVGMLCSFKKNLLSN
jgi:hypothetical protein